MSHSLDESHSLGAVSSNLRSYIFRFDESQPQTASLRITTGASGLHKTNNLVDGLYIFPRGIDSQLVLDISSTFFFPKISSQLIFSSLQNYAALDRLSARKFVRRAQRSSLEKTQKSPSISYCY